MSQQLVSKSAFSRMAGVSPAAITKGVRIQAAMVGHRVDINHLAAKKYLKSKGITLRKTNRSRANESKPVDEKPKKIVRGRAAKIQKEKQGEYQGPAEMDVLLLPDDIRELAEKSLNELISIFGTDTRFKDWLLANKAIEDLHTKQINNAKLLKELVHRSKLKYILDTVDSFHVRVLTDGAKTMSRKCHSKAKAGATPEECEQLMQKEIGKFIKPMKAQIQRGLKDE